MPKDRRFGKPTLASVQHGGEGAAVRLVRQLREELGTSHGGARVANQLGYGVSRCASGFQQADIDDGASPG